MPQTLRTLFAERRYRRTAIIAFVVYFFIYLLSIQSVSVSFAPSREPAWSFALLPQWREVLLRMRAPFLFEPVIAIHAGPVAFFLPPLNLAIGAIVSTLVGANIAASRYLFARLGLRGARGAATLLGTLPALLGGAACCVPTLILLLGIQLSATAVATWPFLVPLGIIMLALSLWWSLRSIRLRGPRQPAPVI